MKMRKTPKNAPILVTMILLPYVLIRTAMDLVMWLIDVICDGIQALGPRFQGFVTGMAATLAGLIILAGMAAYC